MVAATAVALLCGCATRPAYLPSPTRAYAGFQAFDQPTPEAAVGALWIDSYGTSGEPASADNLVTERSMSGIMIDSGFQASMSLGILQFLDLDPSLRNKFTARLNDVSIVRVKNMAKLTGPAGQARLYEALKAASITITATRDVGLDIEARAAQQNLPVFGRGTTGRLSTFTIEAKDMFFAFRVARQVEIASRPATVRLSASTSTKFRIDGLDLRLDGEARDGKCLATLTVASKGIAVLDRKQLALGTEGVSISLPLPRATANRGLLDTIWLRAKRKAGEQASCVSERIDIWLSGTRTELLRNGTWQGTATRASGPAQSVSAVPKSAPVTGPALSAPIGVGGGLGGPAQPNALSTPTPVVPPR